MGWRPGTIVPGTIVLIRQGMTYVCVGGVNMTEYYETDDGVPPEIPDKQSGGDPGLIWAGKVGAVVIAVFVVVIIAASNHTQENNEAARQEVLASRGMSDSDKPEFTKAQFMAEVEGKTKAEVRARFGQPDNVDDGSDSWFYWHLPVYDEFAGTQVNNTQIRFDGISGPDDRVAQVRYP
jgi:hypothetical protein